MMHSFFEIKYIKLVIVFDIVMHIQTPKRPASEDASTLLVDTPRRKLIKTNQQKENGRTSPSTNSNSIESEIISSSSLLQPASSTNTEVEDDQEYLSIPEQPPTLPMFDDDDDLSRQVEQCFRDNSEQNLEDHFMQIDQQLSQGLNKKINNIFI